MDLTARFCPTRAHAGAPVAAPGVKDKVHLCVCVPAV